MARAKSNTEIDLVMDELEKEEQIAKLKKELKDSKYKVDDIEQASKFMDKYEQMAQASEITTPDEARAKISMILAESKNAKILSDLTDKEITLLSALQTIADQTNNKLLSKFILNFLQMRISRNRKGREEIIRVARSSGEEEQMKKSFRSMILGLR